ncbi:MAG: ABC transporter ATP-binding protein [Turicibacter sp.]|jgi:ATP-binding cassette subfamily B multidrug efflux pump|uniref:ABC transporter n=1 Tax=Turicibacter faecis TaxID=2963365 RepID=A0ABN6ZKQ2_9FIRM|nr:MULTISPECIES: ABC transporter ATP-binding protein [unclassified Turicibacter]MCI8702532.1 ABC transporter ATP-binding protein [Turicibacter sp.]MCU7205472.1 ABC transporter ATP-binding protein/permease [Turicibacter sp. TA25]MCU7208450.1 ABC transporter ATP-binding protein/permease [Turicibacter sp. 1E2]BEH91916.1 ABC transporter [Turicibacter sp. TC023]
MAGPMGGPKPGGAKAKDFKGSLLRLGKYLKPYRVGLVIVFVAAIMSVVFSIVSPKIMAKITDELMRPILEMVGGNVSPLPIDFSYIFKIILILIGLYVLSAAFNYLQQFIMAGISQKVVYDLRRDIDEKLARLPLKFFDSHTNGELLSRFTNDVDNISGTLQQSITQVITSVTTVIGVLFMMLTISPLLTVVSIIVIPLSGVLMMLVIKRSQKYFIGQQKELGDLNGHIEEMYTGHNVVKAFGHEHQAIHEFEEINDRLYNVGWRAQFLSGLVMPIISFIGNLGYVLVAVIGGVLVTKGRITVGDIQAFIQYNRQFTQPIAQIAQISNIIQSTVASAERVFELLDESEVIPDPTTPQCPKEDLGAVEFEHVKFGYREDRILINDMNIKAEPGQMVAIVGPTGAGKTTLVNLLLRFYELNGGRILVDGVDITNMTRAALRKKFGMVLQDTWLFNGTIRDNIAYGRENATEEEIVAAAKAAHADHFIRVLPDGYDTILNEEVSNISQGQKQLLTIARALLADPEIMILDEATSSVDTRTELQIQTAMKTLMKGRTSFVIAHRLSTIREADVILVMKDGDVIETGNHESLMKQNGFYADLYNSQFNQEEEEA